jgi:hypothetical protein
MAADRIFMPHHPEPIRAARYFLFRLAPNTAGAEKASELAADAAKKSRREMLIIVLPTSVGSVPFFVNTTILSVSLRSCHHPGMKLFRSLSRHSPATRATAA